MSKPWYFSQLSTLWLPLDSTKNFILKYLNFWESNIFEENSVIDDDHWEYAKNEHCIGFEYIL